MMNFDKSVSTERQRDGNRWWNENKNRLSERETLKGNTNTMSKDIENQKTD